MKNLIKYCKHEIIELALVVAYVIMVLYTNYVHPLPDSIISDLVVYAMFLLIVLFIGIDVDKVLFKKEES